MCPVCARVVVANEVVRKGFCPKNGDWIKCDLATRRVEPAVVVNESQMVGRADLPINLWEKRKTICASRALNQIAINRSDSVRDLLYVCRKVWISRQWRHSKTPWDGIRRIGCGQRRSIRNTEIRL